MHIDLSGTILNGSFLQNFGDAEHIISPLYADFKESVSYTPRTCMLFSGIESK